eukprot:c15201_g1_i1 orf=272-1018(-)
MGLFSNRVDRKDLKPGDHIYSWRIAYAYAHHGIYVGDNKVIHFTRGHGHELGTGTFLDLFIISSRSSCSAKTCGSCGPRDGSKGVILTCLDCFLSGGSLYRFQYGENAAVFLAKARGGTCTLAEADPPEAVLHRARYLLENGFGCYHIFQNNCEDFAMYCKTGFLVMEGNTIGQSGQAVSFIGAPIAAVFSSPMQLLTNKPWGMIVVSAGMYCLSRYAADLGIRRDAFKFAVEDLVVKLGYFPPSNGQ